MTSTASPVRERVELIELTKWCPPILKTRMSRGQVVEGMPQITFWFGLILSASSLILIADGLGWINLGAEQNLADGISVGLGLIGLLMGVWFARWGDQKIKKMNWSKERKAKYPQEPWLYDFKWKPSGIRNDLASQILNRLSMSGFTAVLLGPVAYMFFLLYEDREDVSLLVFIVIAGSFVLLSLILFTAFILIFYQSLQLIRYGNSNLVFEQVPFYLNDKLKVVLSGIPQQSDLITMDLRCIEEEHEVRGRNYVVKYFQLYRDSRKLSANEILGKKLISIEWDLPGEPELTSTLSERPARYWELEVKADTPGVDYHSRFLLPIYSRG